MRIFFIFLLKMNIQKLFDLQKHLEFLDEEKQVDYIFKLRFNIDLNNKEGVKFLFGRVLSGISFEEFQEWLTQNNNKLYLKLKFRDAKYNFRTALHKKITGNKKLTIALYLDKDKLFEDKFKIFSLGIHLLFDELQIRKSTFINIEETFKHALIQI